MESEIETRLNALAENQARVLESVEKTRRYIFWSLVLQLAVVILPLIVLMFAVPFLLSSLSNISNVYQGL